MESNGKSVIAFRGDSTTRCLRVHQRMGAPAECLLEHRLSQNPGDSEAEIPFWGIQALTLLAPG